MTLTTKPRWDKYDGYVGNFRASLFASIDLVNQSNKVLAVGLNSVGAVVIGSGQTGIAGLMIIPVGADIHGQLLDGGINTQAGDPCDVGKHGEITNFVDSLGGNAAGANYYGHPDGSVLQSTAAGAVYVGHTVEATRLVVDMGHSGVGALQGNTPINVGVGTVTGNGAAAQVPVFWTPVRNATGYKITTSADGTTYTAPSTGATAAANATGVTVSGLAAGLKYIKVVATVGGVDSVASNPAIVTIPA